MNFADIIRRLIEQYNNREEDTTPTPVPPPTTTPPTPTNPTERSITIQSGDSNSKPGHQWMLMSIPQGTITKVKVDGSNAFTAFVEGRHYWYIKDEYVKEGKVKIYTKSIVYSSLIGTPEVGTPPPSGSRVYADEYRGLTNSNRPTWFVPIDLHVGQTVTFKAGPVKETVKLYLRKGVPGWEGNRNICKESDSRPGHAAVLINSKYRGSYKKSDCYIEVH